MLKATVVSVPYGCMITIPEMILLHYHAHGTKERLHLFKINLFKWNVLNVCNMLEVILMKKTQKLLLSIHYRNKCY